MIVRATKRKKKKPKRSRGDVARADSGLANRKGWERYPSSPFIMVKKGELIELIAGEKVLYLGEGNVLFRGQVRRVNPSTTNAIAIGHVATASSLKLP